MVLFNFPLDFLRKGSVTVVMKTITKTCAIYTRKSTDERLDMEFNTLDAQREACEAYIMSQRSEGWTAAAAQYDDGGFSGGSLERPALTQLLTDIKAGKIDIVVVYKIDRLTRSLADFAKLVDVFDVHDVTFVSVTQSFNTTTSMGRLTLNVLLSFAQFEREVSGERIRDKIAASKAKGMWQGGRPPFGFDIGDRRLVINEEDAPAAKQIFELYLELDCVRKLTDELKRLGIKSRRRTSQRGLEYGGTYFSRGALHSLLTNPVYIGKIRHIDQIHHGLHDAIIPQKLWDAVQNKLRNKATFNRGEELQRHNNMLTGLIFDEHGRSYTPVFTTKKDRKYRYYCNQELARDKQHPDHLRARFPAHEIESLIESVLRDQIHKLSGENDDAIQQYLLKHHEVLSTYELIRTCVKRVTVYFDTLNIVFKAQNFQKLVDKHLRVSITGNAEEFNITVPFQTKRGRDGAMIIEAEGRDVMNMPQEDLKRLVQGIVWRDEHFAGAHIKDIAARESCSDRYVRNRIMASFETLN